LLAFLLFKKPKRIANSLRAPNYSKTSSIQERKKEKRKEKKSFSLHKAGTQLLSLSLFFSFFHWTDIGKKRKKRFMVFSVFSAFYLCGMKRKSNHARRENKKKEGRNFIF